jgi:hypothetical protein
MIPPQKLSRQTRFLQTALKKNESQHLYAISGRAAKALHKTGWCADVMPGTLIGGSVVARLSRGFSFAFASTGTLVALFALAAAFALAALARTCIIADLGSCSTSMRLWLVAIYGRWHEVSVSPVLCQTELARKRAYVQQYRSLRALERQPKIIEWEHARIVEARLSLNVTAKSCGHRTPRQGSPLNSWKYAEVSTPSEPSLHIEKAAFRIGRSVRCQAVFPMVDAIDHGSVLRQICDSKQS